MRAVAHGWSLEDVRDAQPHPVEHHELPAPTLTLVVAADEGLRVGEGAAPLRAFVAGLQGRPLRTVDDGVVDLVLVRVPPPLARSLLGLPLHEISGTVAPLEALWGSAATELADRVAASPPGPARRALVVAALGAAARQGPLPRREVVAAWSTLVASAGGSPVADLVREVGWDRARLRRGFMVDIGVTPKKAALLIRFGAAVHGLRSGRPPSQVAADAGYFDVAHLHRDVRRFAGSTPKDLADIA